MEFDFKITTWERVTVDPKHEASVLQAIKEGKITSANDVFEFLSDKNDSDIDCFKIADTDEQMTVEENGGNSTIEVLGEDGETIYSNGVI